MARLKALWLNMVDSLWFVPALLTVVGAAAALLLVNYNDVLLGELDPTTRWWAFGGSAQGASGVLGAIASGIITVTGVVFSVTIVALQLASSQFTPRVLRQFTSDRGNQIVLGVFIGTFTYTLLVQRTLRNADGGAEFVPHVAVTVAVALALLSIGFLIFFIDHAARSIQASVIIDAVAVDTMRVLRNIYPERLPDGESAQPPVLAADYTDGRQDEPWRIASEDAGYIQAVDRGAMRQIAAQRQLLVRVDVEIGRFILPGDGLMCVWPAEDMSQDIEQELRRALVLGMERTPHQDLKFGVIELMDIAVKAMSPSVNDPTTALNAIDRLGEILHEMAWRRRGDLIELSPDGRPLLLTRRPALESTVGIAFDQVRHYSASNPTVAIALARLLGRLAAVTPADARASFVAHLHEVKSSAVARITDMVDRQRFDRAYEEALRVAGGEAAQRVASRAS